MSLSKLKALARAYSRAALSFMPNTILGTRRCHRLPGARSLTPPSLILKKTSLWCNKIFLEKLRRYVQRRRFRHRHVD
ncbi:hypothetical protein ACS0TY_033582 [Phlomoides rotata]